MATSVKDQNPIHQFHMRFREYMTTWRADHDDPDVMQKFEILFHELEEFEQREPLKRLWWMMEALSGGLRETGTGNPLKLEIIFERIERQLSGIQIPATHDDMRIPRNQLVKDILQEMQPAVEKHRQCRKVFEFYNPGYWHH